MARILALTVALAVLGPPGVRAQGPSADVKTGTDVPAMLERYHHGRYDEAVATAAALPDLGAFRLHFVQDTPRWVAADSVRIEARRAVR